MRLLSHLLTVSACLLMAPALGADSPVPAGAPRYPAARVSDQVDDYHGVKVADPYRWLEDSESAETRAWIEAQNALSSSYLEGIPQREPIRRRLTRLWDYEKYNQPTERGGRYFYSHNSGLQNQSVLYVTEGLEGEPRVLLDPNTLSKDGTVSLSGIGISNDGSLLAYGLATAGSDWNEWRVRDVATGEDLEDHLKWVKFSGASWTHDNKGFFYSRYDEPTPGKALSEASFHRKLYYHRLGTPQSEDTLIHERPDQPEWGVNGSVTEDGRYLIIFVSRGTDPRNMVCYKDLSRPDSPVVELLNTFDAAYGFVGNDGPVFWFQTTKDAPRRRVVAIDTQRPEPEHWKEIIPQSEDTLQGVRVVNDTFIAQYLHHARSVVKLYGLNGESRGELALPGIGSAGGFTGRRKDAEVFYHYGSFTSPSAIYRYDFKTGQSAIHRRPKVDFDPSAFHVEQVFYRSKDGTRVPMFLTYRKGLKRDGSNPTLLTGYGGFNVAITPGFSRTAVLWMEMGGVYAAPGLRGGGEYGEAWHRAGTKLNKQNVFDDFIAAAEWLIENEYTSPGRLAIRGGSNGGLLVGVVMTQRPELFGAALPAVGVMDMLRYHRFTIGHAWAPDYGTSDNKEEFEALYRYSPLHNIKPGTAYPTTLVTTADHDDRVVPAHSYKFAAALQAAQAGDNPTLIRIDTKAGHGGGKPTEKAIEEQADIYAFLARVFDIRVSERGGRLAVPPATE